MEKIASPVQTLHLEPRLETYTDYRKFLREYYDYKKSLRTGLSYRSLSKRAGLKSFNYLQLVTSGQRNLRPETARRIAKALGLKPEEQTYFTALVVFGNSTSDAERAEAQHALLGAYKKLVTKSFTSEHEKVLAEWHHLIIRELVLLKDFRADFDWICKKLNGLITKEQAQESLSLLLKTGLLREERGQLKVTAQIVDTGNTYGIHKIVQAHLATFEVWKKILPTLEANQRELGLLNISFSKTSLPKFMDRLRAFQDEMLALAEEDKSPDQVFQMGVYLVPVSR